MRRLALALVTGVGLAGVSSSQFEWNDLPLAAGVFRE